MVWIIQWFRFVRFRRFCAGSGSQGELGGFYRWLYWNFCWLFWEKMRNWEKWNISEYDIFALNNYQRNYSRHLKNVLLNSTSNQRLIYLHFSQLSAHSTCCLASPYWLWASIWCRRKSSLTLKVSPKDSVSSKTTKLRNKLRVLCKLFEVFVVFEVFRLLIRKSLINCSKCCFSQMRLFHGIL